VCVCEGVDGGGGEISVRWGICHFLPFFRGGLFFFSFLFFSSDHSGIINKPF